MSDSFNKEQLLHVTLLLTLLTNVLVTIGTVTPSWFVLTTSTGLNSRGPFCRNTDNADRECLPTSLDALCVISITILSAITVLGVLLIKPTIKIEIARISLIIMLFVVSVLLLAILPARNNSYGYSFQLMMTACALAPLNLFVIGVRLGRIFGTGSPERITLCTEMTLSSLARGLTALITVFTIVGMLTNHWIGTNTLGGWSGAGTFCRNSNITADPCLIPISTTVLSVTASVLSLLAFVFALFGILNAIRRQVECYALTAVMLPTSVILWFTIATAIRLESTGYSYRVIVAAGPFTHFALLFAGGWFSISGDPPPMPVRRF
jgi:hypothetical protein